MPGIAGRVGGAAAAQSAGRRLKLRDELVNASVQQDSAVGTAASRTIKRNASAFMIASDGRGGRGKRGPAHEDVHGSETAANRIGRVLAGVFFGAESIAEAKAVRTTTDARMVGTNVTAAELSAALNVGCCGSARHDQLARQLAKIRDNRYFRGFIICVIILAGGLVGLQTYSVVQGPDGQSLPIMDVLDALITTVFVFEIVLKMAAEGKYILRYFLDPWNVFDFVIVLLGMLPFGTSAVTTLRGVRLLRVLRLVRALPRLQVLILGLLASLSSIGYVLLLLLLLFYLYAVLGVSLFATNDPLHWGSLHVGLLTLFRVATLEDWTDVMETNIRGCDEYGYEQHPQLCTDPDPNPTAAVIYFVSFVIISAFCLLNLFIGIISTSISEAQSALQAQAESEDTADATDEDTMLEAKLQQLTEVMANIADEVEVFAVIEKQRKAAAALHGDQAAGHSTTHSPRQLFREIAMKSVAQPIIDDVAPAGQKPAQRAASPPAVASPQSEEPSSHGHPGRHSSHSPDMAAHAYGEAARAAGPHGDWVTTDDSDSEIARAHSFQSGTGRQGQTTNALAAQHRPGMHATRSFTAGMTTPVRPQVLDAITEVDTPAA